MGSKASYQFEFDIEDWVEGVPFVRVGDRVRGKAITTAQSDLNLNKLEVQLMWKAHGKGTPNLGIVARECPRDVTSMREGTPVEVDFEFVVPVDAPVTYDGKIVKISWGVRTYLDIPWAIDDEDSAPLLVLPKMEDQIPPTGGRPHRLESTGSFGGCLIFFGLILTLAFGGGGFAFLEDSIVPALIFWFFGLFGVAMVVAGVHSLMGASLFQELYLEVPTDRLRIGQRLPIELCWSAARGFRVDTVSVKFYLQEKAVFRRGTDSTTYTEERFVQEQTLDVGRDFRKGESHSVKYEFKLPPDGPPSFGASNNELNWKLEATMDVPSWPDPADSWKLPVISIFHPDAFEESEGVGD